MKRIKVLKAYFIIWLFILYVVYVNADLLGIFFMATVIFSTSIVGLLAVGTLYQLVSGLDILMLGGTFGALAYKKTGYEFYLRSIDSLLPANIAHMLQSRKSQQTMLFTQEESRNIIEWLEDKFHKQKSYINFFINTSMLLGLLGTFVGLVEAIDSMGQIILSLNGEIDIKEIMQDFSGPLSGMAIGFGASLFGVVAAVILGINGYILFRSQDTLISGIEDWLKDRIIDIAPEIMGRSTSMTTVDLPDQRKTFMDIFLEQMTNFTQEISKLSKSNENLHTMSQTLLAIKTTMDTQQSSLQTMAVSHEKHYGKFDTLSNHIVNAHEITQTRQLEDRAILQSLFANQSQILEQNGTVLLHVDAGIANMDKKMESHQHSLDVLVTLGEQSSQINEKKHAEVLDAMVSVSTAINEETQAIVALTVAQESKSEQISTLLTSTLSELSKLNTQVDQSSASLLNIASVQKMQFEESIKAYSLMQENILVLNESIQSEIQIFDKFAQAQINNNQTTIENQSLAIEVSKAISSLVDQVRQTLFAVVNTQDTFKEESKQASFELLEAVANVNQSLHVNKESLESILATQENFSTNYSHLQEVANGVLRSINETVVAESITTSDILDTSTRIHEIQNSSAKENLQALDGLVIELSRIENTALLDAQERKAFEEAYFKHSSEKQAIIVAQLSQKIERTEVKLATMSESLKNIEEVLMKFDKNSTLHGPGVADEIKGFFTTLFGKNQ